MQQYQAGGRSYRGGARTVHGGTGRGASNRGSFRQVRVPAPTGLIPTLPFLNARAGGTISPDTLHNWVDAINTYAKTNYIPGLAAVCTTSTTAAYPEYEEPEVPAAGSTTYPGRIWEIKYRQYAENVQRLASDKVKLTGVILGQMGNMTKDLVKRRQEGVDAIANNDPLNLIKAVVATHLIGSDVDDMRNYYAAETNYRDHLRMSETESIETYRRRFNEYIASLTEAATRAAQAGKVPAAEAQAIHFVERLASAYSDFKIAIRRHMVTAPTSVQEAYEAAINFGTDIRSERRYSTTTHAGVFYTDGGRSRGNSSSRGRRGGGRGSGRSGRGRGACVICGEYGHWKNECPSKDGKEDRQINEAISDFRSAGGGGKPGGKVTKNN